MAALLQTLTVVGLILAVWTIVPGVLFVVLVRVWRHYYVRVDTGPHDDVDTR